MRLAPAYPNYGTDVVVLAVTFCTRLHNCIPQGCIVGMYVLSTYIQELQALKLIKVHYVLVKVQYVNTFYLHVPLLYYVYLQHTISRIYMYVRVHVHVHVPLHRL